MYSTGKVLASFYLLCMAYLVLIDLAIECCFIHQIQRVLLILDLLIPFLVYHLKYSASSASIIWKRSFSESLTTKVKLFGPVAS